MFSSCLYPVVDKDGVYVFLRMDYSLHLLHEGQELWRLSLTDEYGPMKGNQLDLPCQLGEVLVS